MPQLAQSLEKDHQTRLDRRQHRRLHFERDQMRSPIDHDYESVAQSVDVQVHDDELIHSVLSRDIRELR